MISQKARYSFKALIALARRPDETVPIRDIAEAENIPRSFLEQILLDLKRHRIVGSRRGKVGGYYLAQPAGEITLGQILRLSDGPIAPLSCLSRQSYRRCEDCPSESACALRIAFKEAFDAQADVLERTTLEQAAARGAPILGKAENAQDQTFIGAGI